MSATTPGPWQLSEKLGGPHPDLPHLEYFHVLGPEGDWDLNLNIAGYMRRADANLIAAAPDLLASVRELRQALAADGRAWALMHPDMRWPLYEKIMRADDAIAKAEGQS